MKNRFTVLSLLLFLGFSSLIAGRIELKGIYQGKNLFIENKLISKKQYCVTNVYVNDKHVLDHPKKSIIEIDLSSFKKGEHLKIRVYHREGCKPEMMNPRVLSENQFEFIRLDVTADEIHWESQGELEIGKYIVQQKLNNKWQDIKYVKGNSYSTDNSYTVIADHTAGLNEYRVKYRGTGGFVKYSEEKTFSSNKSVVSFYPTRVTDVITFVSDDQRSVNYTVYSLQGRKLITGSGVNINCQGLSKGEYYKLYYDNKESSFYMKE